jgi:hypothetical protein
MSRIKNIEVEARNNGTYGAFAIGEGIYQKGLTKREYFAGLAMQGLLASNARDKVAYNAVKYANSLLNELEKHELETSNQQEQ